MVVNVISLIVMVICCWLDLVLVGRMYARTLTILIDMEMHSAHLRTQ